MFFLYVSNYIICIYLLQDLMKSENVRYEFTNYNQIIVD